MATGQMTEVIQHLRRAVLLRDGAGLTDRQLLEGYLSHGDEAALAALVRRHGPMIWGVCRRVLHNYHDAEDAFQATFLVLVRKAASIASRELLANWLYGVAHQTALKARATAAKRKTRERQVNDLPEPEAVLHGLWPDVQPLLDQELSCLPDYYRAVIVLCDLEGKTRKEAARQLGCPEGTVAGRLARARVMLAKRLAGRGLTVSGGTLAAMWSQNAASASVPTSVVSNTIRAAVFAAGQATGLISVHVAALTEGVVRMMLLTKLKTAGMVLLIVAVVAAAVGGLGYQGVRAADEAKADDRAKPPVSAQVEKPRQADEGGKKQALNDDIPNEEELGRLVGPVLTARLKVSLAGGNVVSVKGRKLPVELKITSLNDEPQEFLVAEYRIGLLDKDGEAVYGGLILHDGLKKKVALKGRSTITVKLDLEFDPVVRPGQEYYLFCALRNQVGMVKLATKE